MLVYHASEEHCGEERAYNTNNPRCCEASDRSCTRYKQDDTCDERCEVRVEDGTEGVLVAKLQRLLNALSFTHLFLDAFVYQHVGIDGSTQRQHDTGYTRHCQCRLEGCQNTQCEEQVGYQGQVGQHTGDEVVHENHVDHQQYEGYNKRCDTLLYGLCTQCRSNHLFLNDAGRCRHTS